MRTTPRGGKLVISPADGLVTMIAKVPPPPELRGADGLGDLSAASERVRQPPA